MLSSAPKNAEFSAPIAVKKPNPYFLVFLALFILPISGLSIDIYTPSLPAVSNFFGINQSLAQLTITTYMIGLGIMQLFAGPISDSFGRRQPYLIAMFFYIIATLIIPFSPSIQVLLFLRFLQGAMVAIMAVPLRSVISDLFEGREYYRMVNYMTMAWSIGPIIAPVIGGYLQHYFGWQSNFYFLGIYSLISFVLNMLYLPDTSNVHHPFHVIKIFERYKEIVSNKIFMTSIMMNGLLYSLIILFSIVAPFLLQTVLHYTPIEFGHVALVVGITWFIGGSLARVVSHVPFNYRSLFVVYSMLIISLGFFVIDLVIPMNIVLVVLPTILLTLIEGMIFSDNFARGVSLFPDATGSANALFSGATFFISGLASGLGSYLKTTNLMPLISSYLLISLLCLSLHYIQKKLASDASSPIQ